MHEELLSILKTLGPFYYLPNPGNLGDLLIAEATRKFFRKNNLVFFPYDEDSLPDRYRLVYGGGGRLVPLWCSHMDELVELFTGSRVEECVLLPQSIRDVDALMGKFDGRHHIFCRDLASFEYCKAAAPDARCYLADDMAFEYEPREALREILGVEGFASRNRSTSHADPSLIRQMHRGIKGASVYHEISGRMASIAFLFRRDTEKLSQYGTEASFDLSGVIPYTKAGETACNSEIMAQFSLALKQVDIVVSDRLHVCIMAYLSGLEVYMLDNSYGKLSGVYQLSMADSPRVHMLPCARLTPELEAAWRRLNAPWKVFFRRCRNVFRGLYRRGRAVVSRLCRCV